MKLQHVWVLLPLVLTLIQCESRSGGVGDPCRNRSECNPDLKCSGGLCYSPEAPSSATVNPPDKSQSLRCHQRQECRQYGRCSEGVGGSCIPTLDAHCKKATVGCKRLKRCTYVPTVHKCCTDMTGSDCNPVMGQKVPILETDPPPTPKTPSPP